MADEFISSFDGTKLFYNAEASADDRAVIVMVHGLCEHQGRYDYVAERFHEAGIGTFQVFAQSFIMTAGGPVNSTLFYVYHLFNNAFRYLNMGYAAAMAWFLFLIVLILTAIQMKLSEKWVHYEGD